ncbi:MAG: hypothetical protein FWD38_09375 [Oscillospiraceae bacterium]|nr:hypothetical protein [Oscillospiraceae bacterium]
MRGYVLTERGKLLVAMLIVLFVILPSVVFIVRASSRGTSATGTPHGSAEAPKNTPDLMQFLPANEEDDKDEPETVTPSLTGPISFDLDEGEMIFLYMPDSQDTLDDATISKIGELLGSPKNTSDTKIAIEIPQLSDSDAGNLTSAVINAFEINHVPLSEIVFLVNRTEPDAKIFEVKISFRES